MPTCVLTPDQKAIGHPVDICTSAICCGYLTLNVRMSGVTSPLRCSAALLRQIICTFSVAGSPQSTLTGRPPSPGGDILEQAFSVYWSAAAVLIMENTHNEVRKITGSIIWGIFLLLQFCM